MKFLIILYAVGIVVLAMQPLKPYWGPYYREGKLTVQRYIEWTDPPRRTAGNTPTTSTKRGIGNGIEKRKEPEDKGSGKSESLFGKIWTFPKDEVPQSKSATTNTAGDVNEPLDEILPKDQQELDHLLGDIAE